MGMFTKLKIQLSNVLFLWLPFIVLVIPIRFLIAWMISALIHEMGHIVMIKLLRIQIHKIQISILGAKIYTDSTEQHQELLCAAAGPLASFCVMLFSRYVPLVAVCSFFHGAVNLLPYENLDGARVLRCILHMFMRDSFAEKTILWINRACILCFAFVAVIVTVYGRNLSFLIVPVLLLLRKSPCNASAERVQYR